MKKNYLCVWRNFSKFFMKLDEKPNNWEDRILLYTGFLINEGKKSQTVKSTYPQLNLSSEKMDSGCLKTHVY